MLVAPERLADWGLPGVLVLGVLTALQPCALTTNLAAFTLLSAWSGDRRRSLLSGLFLVAGMCVLYSALAFALAGSAVRAAAAAMLVRELASFFLGPLIMLAGGLMTGLLQGKGLIPLKGVAGWFGRSGRGVEVRAFALGVVLAAAFCPVSAGIFFAVLVPLAIVRGHPAAYAAVFGVGFGLPMLVVLLGLMLGIMSSERIRHAVRRLPQIAGWLLVAIGAWLTWRMLIR